MQTQVVRRREILYDGWIGAGRGTMPTGLLQQIEFLQEIVDNIPPEHKADAQVEFRIRKLGSDEDVLVSVFYLRPPSREEMEGAYYTELAKDVEEFDRIAAKYGKPAFGETKSTNLLNTERTQINHKGVR